MSCILFRSLSVTPPRCDDIRLRGRLRARRHFRSRRRGLQRLSGPEGCPRCQRVACRYPNRREKSRSPGAASLPKTRTSTRGRPVSLTADSRARIIQFVLRRRGRIRVTAKQVRNENRSRNSRFFQKCPILHQMSGTDEISAYNVIWVRVACISMNIGVHCNDNCIVLFFGPVGPGRARAPAQPCPVPAPAPQNIRGSRSADAAVGLRASCPPLAAPVRWEPNEHRRGDVRPADIEAPEDPKSATELGRQSVAVPDRVGRHTLFIEFYSASYTCISV